MILSVNSRGGTAALKSFYNHLPMNLDPLQIWIRELAVKARDLRRRPPASITTADGNTTTMLASSADAVCGLSSPIHL